MQSFLKNLGLWYKNWRSSAIDFSELGLDFDAATSCRRQLLPTQLHKSFYSAIDIFSKQSNNYLSVDSC